MTSPSLMIGLEALIAGKANCTWRWWPVSRLANPPATKSSAAPWRSSCSSSLTKLLSWGTWP